MSSLLHQSFFKEAYAICSWQDLNASQLEMIRQWRNHPLNQLWFYHQHEISPDEHLQFVSSLHSDSKNGYWLVQKAQEAIGVISINRLQPYFKHAYLGIYTCPEAGQKGLGQICLQLLLYLAFEKFDLHCLRLEVFSNNQAALRLYQKMGFELEGCLRDYALYQGNYQDVFVMSLLARDYKA